MVRKVADVVFQVQTLEDGAIASRSNEAAHVIPRPNEAPCDALTEEPGGAGEEDQVFNRAASRKGAVPSQIYSTPFGGAREGTAPLRNAALSR